MSTKRPSKRRLAFEKSLTTIDRKTVKVYATFEEAEEAMDAYWRSRTPTERLIALEHMRQTTWGYNDDYQPRLRGSPELLKLRRRTLSGPGRIRG